MNTGTITAVGIDVSKHKSTVAARRPGGEVVLLPFDVEHTAEGLKKLITKLRQLDGEIRIIMEHTGMYWRPIAMTLKEAGFYVSVVNAILIHNFSDNSIRNVKKWCKRTGYKFSASDAERIHAIARNAVATLPKNDSTKLLITQATNSLNAIYDSLQAIRTEMDRLASMLPEYELVMGMEGIGKVTGPQLMAEVGDVRRFSHKGALVAYAGVDASPYQSGSFDSKSRHVSKRGSPHLRRVLFVIMSMTLIRANTANPVFCFMDKKRAEGKHFYVYTVAGSAKFLRIYYAKVKEHLNALEETA